MGDALFFNDRFTTTDEPVISVEDRGFQFGDAVYETIKFLQGTILFGADHFRRLQQSLQEISIIHPWSEATFLETMGQLLDRTSFNDGIVYVQISRGVEERSHFYAEGMQPTTVAYSRRFSFPGAERKQNGIGVITTEDTRWKLCNVKSVNLLGNVMAKKIAERAGGDEALLVSGDEVREGASSSFFGVLEGRLITHPADCRVLPGVVRHHVIDFARALAIPFEERPLRVAELTNLDEAFITNTTQGVMPVTRIDGKAVGYGRRGGLTERLQVLFDAEEEREAGAPVS
jgi:D-alanine transaminase